MQLPQPRGHGQQRLGCNKRLVKAWGVQGFRVCRAFGFWLREFQAEVFDPGHERYLRIRSIQVGGGGLQELVWALMRHLTSRSSQRCGYSFKVKGLGFFGGFLFMGFAVLGFTL